MVARQNKGKNRLFYYLFLFSNCVFSSHIYLISLKKYTTSADLIQVSYQFHSCFTLANHYFHTHQLSQPKQGGKKSKYLQLPIYYVSISRTLFWYGYFQKLSFFLITGFATQNLIRKPFLMVSWHTPVFYRGGDFKWVQRAELLWSLWTCVFFYIL